MVTREILEQARATGGKCVYIAGTIGCRLAWLEMQHDGGAIGLRTLSSWPRRAAMLDVGASLEIVDAERPSALDTLRGQRFKRAWVEESADSPELRDVLVPALVDARGGIVVL